MRTTSHTRLIVRHLTTHVTRHLAAAGVALAAGAVLAAPSAAQGHWDPGSGSTGNGGYGSNGGYGNNGRYGRRADGAQPLFAWRGRVDREAYIIMQNGGVRTQIDGYDNGAGGGARVASALPQADGVVDVRLQQGRGRVDVVEQPSSRNGYRAVVRVRDDDAGADNYRLVATWRPTGGYANGQYANGQYGNGQYGNGGYGSGSDGRDRDDGRYGRDRRRDDGDGRYGNGQYGNNGRYGNGGYGNGANGAGTYAGSGDLHWRGRVDDVEEIRLQGARVDTRTVSGQGASGVQTRLQGGALPASDVAVRVNDRSGRGRVVVVQQPHASNGYTAVVRVEDHDPGAGWHDFDVTW